MGNIYDVLSKKLKDKADRREKDDARRKKDGPDVPPTVNNYLHNSPSIAKSLNQQPAEDVKRRKISKTEGDPAVNGEAGEELKKKAVKRPKKKKELDPGVAAGHKKSGGKKKTSRRKKKTGK